MGEIVQSAKSGRECAKVNSKQSRESVRVAETVGKEQWEEVRSARNVGEKKRIGKEVESGRISQRSRRELRIRWFHCQHAKR